MTASDRKASVRNALLLAFIVALLAGGPTHATEIPFGAQVAITTDLTDPTGVIPVDIDGDGDLDLVVADDGADSVRWLHNDPPGSFTASTLIASVTDPKIAVADVDGDGDPDVLWTSFTDDQTAWHENDGTGTFGTAQLTGLGGGEEIDVANLDNDGDVDLVLAEGNEINAAFNNGLGVFRGVSLVFTAPIPPHVRCPRRRRRRRRHRRPLQLRRHDLLVRERRRRDLHGLCRPGHRGGHLPRRRRW